MNKKLFLNFKIPQGRGTIINYKKGLKKLTINNYGDAFVLRDGKSILEKQLSVFKNCGIDDITVVTGFKSETINLNVN